MEMSAVGQLLLQGEGPLRVRRAVRIETFGDKATWLGGLCFTLIGCSAKSEGSDRNRWRWAKLGTAVKIGPVRGLARRIVLALHSEVVIVGSSLNRQVPKKS